MRRLRLLVGCLLAFSACGEADEPSLDQAVLIASKASLECGLGDGLHDALWDAYTNLPVTVATLPAIRDVTVSKNSTISFDAGTFQYESPYFQFTFDVTTGTREGEPYTLSSVQFSAAYQDRYCKDSCVVAATYGDVWRSDKTSVRGTPLDFSCIHRTSFPGLSMTYEWRAVPVPSDMAGELVAGFREIIHASYKGRTAVLDVRPRGKDRFCVDGDCKSADISSWDLRALYSRRPNPATAYMPSRFFEDHPLVPSDPQGGY